MKELLMIVAIAFILIALLIALVSCNNQSKDTTPAVPKCVEISKEPLAYDCRFPK